MGAALTRPAARARIPAVMGAISSPPPAKLIVGMLSGRRELLTEAAERLARDYGPIDLTSEATSFDFTHYYDKQMGPNLLRQFVAFERTICPGELARIKRAANDVEDEFAAARTGDPTRPVNLDPGYVTESKLVLASTKDFAHRIYLRDGIYAEVTLTYARGRWAAGDYTFPDYASGAYDAFFTGVRDRLRRQLGRKERSA